MHNQCTWQEQVAARTDFQAKWVAHQRGHLFEWVPVCLGLGIGLYFLITFEPGRGIWLSLGVASLCLAGLARWMPEDLAPLVWAVVFISMGFGLAGLRAHYVAAPVLDFRYYGPITGRIVAIDRSASDAVRLTLDQVHLARVAPHKTPQRIRVSLHGQQGFVQPVPGMTVATTGHLSPPNGPVEPGGYDFQRQAWFQRLGGVGYTRNPVLALAPVQDGALWLIIHRLRQRIGESVRQALPGDLGAFAAALTTGDRSAMSASVLEDLRASNLAHLLAISGLHMGLLTGFVFAALRAVLALIPATAHAWPNRKIAAVVALAAGAFYLAMSGGNVATVRAFTMVAVMFVAILVNRRALTLRAVAVAAIILLALSPEALVSPGFQMSFAATTALVGIFGALRNREMGRVPKWVKPIAAVVLSSAIAGAATAPVAAAHFNRIADYGLIANLLSVPLMGALVMPAAVLAAVLWPFGLAWVGLKIMAWPLAWILGVAGRVADLPGAQSHVVSPAPQVLPLLALGALFVLLWQGGWRARALGLVPIVAGFWLWAMTDRPALLISESGGLIGIMTEQGRALNKPKGDGFTATSWLENDGDPATQELAAARNGMAGDKGNLQLVRGGVSVTHLSGRGATERFARACARSDIVILAAKPAPASDARCFVIDGPYLRRHGASAVQFLAGGYTVSGARTANGRRLWNDAALRRRMVPR